MEDLRDPTEVRKARQASADFSSCLSDLETALRSAIKAFAAHHAADGRVTREQWAKWFEGDPPSQEYIDGFNAGVDSVLMAADSFLDEFPMN